ncbi:MAG TPA: outer membrane protein assembly factor BamD [Methylomirabilota bacterium]|jgi:TolA-binding protein|nr:outer membrane protein assembly factor BamD [Methylomirabilota bacterium]
MTRVQPKGSSGSGLPFLFLLLCVVTLSVAGCADLMTEDAVQQDVAQLRKDVNQLMLSAHRGQGEAETLGQIERRNREQAAESARQVAALGSRMETLNAELVRLSARLEQVSQRVESLGRRAPAAPSAEPAAPPPAPPLSRQAPPPPLPTASAPPPAQPTAPTPSTPTPGPATSMTGPSAAPMAPPPRSPVSSPSREPTAEASYQAAYSDFSKGHYGLAIPAFREFLRRFPDSALADSAQYSIGESYFSMARASAAAGQGDKAGQELEQAVRELRKVVVNYPRGGKVPTALYKEALALTELRQTALAQARFQYLVEHFPQSEEAPLAKERLAALKR